MDRKAEIETKVGRVRAWMDTAGFDGVLLKKIPSYSWLTAGGMNQVPNLTEVGATSLLVTRKETYVIASRIESARAMEEERLEEFGFKLLEYDWFQPREAELVREAAAGGRLACDMDAHGLENTAAELRRLRYVLLPEEAERYQWFGRKVSEAIEAVMLEARPGMSEAEITGELTRRLWQHRIEQVGYQAGADERARKYRHAIPTEKKIGKLLMFNVMARKWGLTLTITRMMHFGKPSDELRKQFDDNMLVENSMIAFTRPGAVAREVFRKTCDLYDRLGYKDEWKKHHQGGSAGYELRDYICTGETAEVVEDGQAFCWNPSIDGTKTEDTFIVRGNGFQFVTLPVLFPSVEQSVEGLTFVRPALLER